MQPGNENQITPQQANHAKNNMKGSLLNHKPIALRHFTVLDLYLIPMWSYMQTE